MTEILKKYRKNERGQSLIEILFALGIALVVLVAVISATVRSVRNAAFAKKKAEAVSFVQKGIEEVRIARDEAGSWEEFSSLSWEETMLDDISRSISVSSPYEGDDYKALIEVTATWEDGAGEHQVSSESILSSWRQ